MEQATSEHNPLLIEAKTLELALVKASAALALPQDQIAYRLLKKDSGIAAFFSRKKITLHAWPRQASAADSSHTTADTPREPDLTPATEQALIDELVGYCRDICRLVVGTEVNCHRSPSGTTLDPRHRQRLALVLCHSLPEDYRVTRTPVAQKTSPPTPRLALSHLRRCQATPRQQRSRDRAAS